MTQVKGASLQPATKDVDHNWTNGSAWKWHWFYGSPLFDISISDDYTLGLLSVVSKTRNPNFYNSLYPWTLPTYYLNSNFTTSVLEDTSNILRRSSPIISTVDMSHKFVYANMHVNEGSTYKKRRSTIFRVFKHHSIHSSFLYFVYFNTANTFFKNFW